MEHGSITVVARTDAAGYEACKTALLRLDCSYIGCFCIISDVLSLSPESTVHGKKLINIYDDNPTSPVGINRALAYIRTSTYFFTFSKEVELEQKHVETLVKELRFPNMLVVGYRFTIPTSKELDQELQAYYANEDLLAYRVPWNTCALWNSRLFIDNIGEFDNIADGDEPLKIGGYTTKRKGMEDGLAIAKAVSSNPTLKYELLSTDPRPWNVDPSKERSHREKLARKDVVLRGFMSERGYSPERLVDAQK